MTAEKPGPRLPPGTGSVARAARSTLRDIETDHAAAPLLIAMGQKLADDVDNADRVSDRIAAVRQILELVRLLDGALLGPNPGPTTDDGGGPDPTGEESDDVFGIGDVPPGVGDSSA